MAVGTEFLGQQVACPHCQQIVVAPAVQTEDVSSESFPPSEPGLFHATFRAPKAPEAESIFSPPPEPDDLFGANSLSRVEGQPASLSSAPESGPANSSFPVSSQLDPARPREEEQASSPVGESFRAPPAESVGGKLVTLPAAARRPQGNGWFTALVFVPLVFYALLATIAVIILYQRQQSETRHPLEEFLPDEEGDTPGARHLKDLTDASKHKLVHHPLAAALRTRLAQPLGIGDLEITPLTVEWRRVSVHVQGYDKAEPCRGDSLVLGLRLRNRSPDVAFHPLDNYFTRKWREEKPNGPPPLTFLEVGTHRFFGGPAPWYPPQVRKDQRAEWVADAHYERELLPGDTMETFVCTDGDDPNVAQALANYSGSLLWRVQVRRGLVEVRGREFSATAVVGVEFTAAEVTGTGL
jgi:hypothetical protein